MIIFRAAEIGDNGKIVHLDPSGNLLGEYDVGGNPMDDAVGPDGKIYITQHFRDSSLISTSSVTSDKPFCS